MAAGKSDIMWKKNLVRLSLLSCFLFIFPNDYKNFISHGALVLNTVTVVFLILMYMIYFPRIIKFISRYWLFSIPFIVVVISSIINDNNTELAVSKLIYLIIFYFIGGIFSEYKREIIKVAEFVSFAILLINGLVTIFHGQPLLYTATAGRIFFIFEGSIGKLLASNILLFYICNAIGIKKNKTMHYVIYILSLYCVSFSATYLFCDVLLLVCMFIVDKVKLGRRLPKIAILYLVVFLVVNALVISGVLSSMLSGIFGKSITLSGRTIIWGAATDVVKENLLIGVGEYSPRFFIELTGVSGATHAHNQLLQTLLSSGIIGLFVYVYYISKVLNPGKYLKDDKIINIYRVYLLVILIMCLTASPFDAFFNLSILMAVYYIDNKKKNIAKYREANIE